MNKKVLKDLAKKHGTPLYVYDLNYLDNRAKLLLNLCKENNYLLRYAIKANPNVQIIKLFDQLGLHFDASSDFEAELLIKNGLKAQKISLSSQQPPRDIKKILQSGVAFVATSMHQLDLVKSSGWKGEIAVRLNPGLGAGHNMRTTTGGVTSSFGIWHEYTPNILSWQKSSAAKISRAHIHIGSGGDPKVWQAAINRALELVKLIPSVQSLNMGGGFKIARVSGEPEADMAKILQIFSDELTKFKEETGRQLSLEIEPGTWLVGNGGYLIAEVVDIVDTGKDGFRFLKLNTGMNDFLRPAMYGAQHPMEVLNDSSGQADYVVVGHNCETGDILTPAPGDPEAIKPRQLNQAKIGDLLAIGGAGAYGSSMRAIGYNSFPSAKEVLT